MTPLKGRGHYVPHGKRSGGKKKKKNQRDRVFTSFAYRKAIKSRLKRGRIVGTNWHLNRSRGGGRDFSDSAQRGGGGSITDLSKMEKELHRKWGESSQPIGARDRRTDA